MRMYYTAHCASPLGRLTLACDGNALSGLWLEGQKYFGATLAGETADREDLPVFRAARRWLERYFAGERPAAGELPLAPAGSAFRRMVWRLLCEIPYGTPVTYGTLAREVARRLGRESMSAQAVGGAVAHNPISIIIPCHRVVGGGGSLTGYAGGIGRKAWLLRHEGAAVEGLRVPAVGAVWPAVF